MNKLSIEPVVGAHAANVQPAERAMLTRPEATKTKIALMPTISNGRARRRQPQMSNFNRQPARSCIASPPVSSTKLLVQIFLLIGNAKSQSKPSCDAHAHRSRAADTTVSIVEPAALDHEARPIAEQRRDDRRQRAEEAFGIGLLAEPAGLGVVCVHVLRREHGSIDEADHVSVGRKIALRSRADWAASASRAQ